MIENTVRIYGDTVEWWKDDKGRMTYTELEYKDYNIYTGEVVGVGTEQFSRERYKTVITKLIWTWDGSERRGDGTRWFDYTGKAVKYNRGDGRKVKMLVKLWYPHVWDINLR